MLIVNAAIAPTVLAHLRIDDGVVAEVAPMLQRRQREEVVDARGCALLPGLHDHHMHLLALAASMQSVDCRCDPPTLRQRISARRAQQPVEIRGAGYHEHGADIIDAAWIDSVCPDIPVRIQHQSGRLWILNSCALRSLAGGDFPQGAERDAHGKLTGRFYHADDWLRSRLPRQTPSLHTVSRELAACGVTGVTDAGPDNDDSVAALLHAAQQRGELLQDVVLMGRADLAPVQSQGLRRGAHKLYLKESELPEFDALCDAIRRSHREDRPVAFHCVTRVEMQFALAALRDAGIHAGDRIEHASVASDDALAQLAELGITVVTQPHFIAERGDRYRAQVEHDEQPLLYRAQALLQAGIALAGGTDAPYGHFDPWRSMRAAVIRCTESGHLMGGEERLTPLQALALYLGEASDPGRRQRNIAPGAKADLCLLDTDWKMMLADLDSQHVSRVWNGGRCIFAR
jgi:predicted amidohydrolase YtcJ